MPDAAPGIATGATLHCGWALAAGGYGRSPELDAQANDLAGLLLMTLTISVCGRLAAGAHDDRSDR